MAHGAEVHVRDENGMGALDLAADQERVEVVRWAIPSLSHLSIYYMRTCRVLLEGGAEATHEDGKAPILRARCNAEVGHIKIEGKQYIAKMDKGLLLD